jgi:hypothetical protein
LKQTVAPSVRLSAYAAPKPQASLRVCPGLRRGHAYKKIGTCFFGEQVCQHHDGVSMMMPIPEKLRARSGIQLITHKPYPKPILKHGENFSVLPKIVLDHRNYFGINKHIITSDRISHPGQVA